MNTRTEVLCVDDEPQVLEGLRLHLKQHFAVHCAVSGAEAIKILHENKNIAVILSDMRMPAMDGAKFLGAAVKAAPEAVRMLLTGYTDMQAAVAAVNEGQIFRFISKPCPPAQLLGAFTAAVNQHRMIVAERVLLQQTLLGCVESLAKVLSIAKPLAFGRALRLRCKANSVATHLQWHDRWQIEAAAMLSQLGAVTLSEELLMRMNDGETMHERDRLDIAMSINTSVKMLKDIPRLEPVIEILQSLPALIMGTTPSPKDRPASTAAKVLNLVMEWDALEAQGYSQITAFGVLAARPSAADPDVLETLKSMPSGPKSQGLAIPSHLSDLLPGMVLAQDLVCRSGIVVLPRGFEIDQGLLDHVLSFGDELHDAPIMVFPRSA